MVTWPRYQNGRWHKALWRVTLSAVNGNVMLWYRAFFLFQHYQRTFCNINLSNMKIFIAEWLRIITCLCIEVSSFLCTAVRSNHFRILNTDQLSYPILNTSKKKVYTCMRVLIWNLVIVRWLNWHRRLWNFLIYILIPRSFSCRDYKLTTFDIDL